MTTTNTKEALTKQAEALGAEAFSRGGMRAPATDPKFATLMRENRETFNANACAVLDAWLSGWDKANLAAPLPPAANDVTERTTKTRPTHFRGNPKFGRTTTLIAGNGAVLIVVMGSVSRRDAFRAWQNELSKN